MKLNTITSTVSLALAIALNANVSMAADEVYPAINCQPYYGTQAGDFNTGSHGIRNNSTGTRLVSCPINRVFDYANGWTTAYPWVHVNYDSQSSNLTCFVYNMDADGGIHSYGIVTGTSGVDKDMHIPTYPRSNTQYQSLFCYLPAGAVLEWYEPSRTGVVK